MRMTEKVFVELVESGPFNFDRAVMPTADLTKMLAKAHRKRPIMFDVAFRGVLVQVEEWMPGDLMLFCNGKDVAAVLNMKTGRYHVNPKHRSKP